MSALSLAGWAKTYLASVIRRQGVLSSVLNKTVVEQLFDNGWTGVLAHAETGGLAGIQGQPTLHRAFQANLGCRVRPSQ